MKLILDAQDEALRDKAYLDDSNGYWRHPTDDGYEYIHRIIAKANAGEIVDHANRDKNDNRRSNLRLVDKSLNNYNREVRNSLGRGVYFDKCGNRFRACISHKNKTLKLGSFSTAEGAMLAYNKKALEIYGKDAFQHDLPHYQIEVKK